MPGMHVKELSPPVRAQQAPPARQASRKPAAPEAMQPARIVQGFAPGNDFQGILKKAQASARRWIPASSSLQCYCQQEYWEVCV